MKVEDYRKFDKMTKPIKFRRIRMLFQTIAMAHDIRRFKWYTFLCKINVLKRFTFKDHLESDFHEPDNFTPRAVETDLFRVFLQCKLGNEIDIYEDYFYKPMKDGSKKVLYVIRDEYKVTKFLICYVKDVGIKIDNKIYMCDERMPVLRFIPEMPLSSAKHPIGDRIEYIQNTYDLSIIKKYISRTILNTFSSEEVSVSYLKAMDQFYKALSKLTLKDIEVNG